MIKKALLAGLESGVIAGEELYNLDDQGLFTLTRQRAHPLFRLVDSVRNGRLFVVAAEIPFDQEAHGKLRKLTGRSCLEESLAAELSSLFGKRLEGNELIIDLPEPVSFESGLFVTDEDCFFSTGSSVFRDGFLDAFVKSLRIIRVFVDPRHEEYLKNQHERILHTTEKWVKLYRGS